MSISSWKNNWQADKRRSLNAMKWFLGVLLLLLAALLLESSLLAYAMYVLLGLLLLSRWLARSWIGSLSATRTCKQLTADIGDRVAVQLTITNDGGLPVPWVLVEDLLPQYALVSASRASRSRASACKSPCSAPARRWR